jgi:hypothetical protein
MPEAPFRNPILSPGGRTPPATTGPVGPYSGQDLAPPPIFNPPPERAQLPIAPRTPPMSTLPVDPYAGADLAPPPIYNFPQQARGGLPPARRPMMGGPGFQPGRGAMPSPIDEMGLWELAMRRMQQY